MNKRTSFVLFCESQLSAFTMASAATHAGLPIGGNGLVQARQGGANVGHRGRGFVPMAAYGSAARVMSPRARTPGKRGPGSRQSPIWLWFP